MKLKKQLEQLLARVAAMQIPIYAGNASFFLLLSVFPIVSLLLSNHAKFFGFRIAEVMVQYSREGEHHEK